MSRAWIRAKKLEFARDLLRDFCLATRDFSQIFAAYEASGSIDYAALRQLTGSVMNKGILWRLKDTSHLLLRGSSTTQPQFADNARLDSFLDWALGYIFHEVVKIREDAHQHENYVPWVQRLQAQSLPPQERGHVDCMVDVLGQTRESLAREIARVRRIIAECIALFPHVLQKYRDSPLLARFLFSQEDLVQEVFGDQRETLVEVLYEDDPQMLYLLAAQSLRQGGWWEPARQALAKAQSLRPECPMVVEETSRMARLCAKIPAARRSANA